MAERSKPFHREEGSGARNLSERICLIVNPRAGAGRAGREMATLEYAVDRAFAQWVIRKTEGPRHAAELAAAAADEGFDLVAAVGGDGTANEVVGGLMDGDNARSRKVTMAVVPFGTGADLIKTLGVPTALTEALWIAATGITLPCDVGHARVTTADGPLERHWINVAGFGVNGDVVLRANKMSKRWGGTLTFLQASVRSMVEYKAPEVEVTWDGPDGPGRWLGKLTSAFVANGAYCGGGMWVGKGGTMVDGYLNLTLLPEASILRNALQSPALYTGHLDRVPGAVLVRATQITAAPMIPGEVCIDLDGEMPGCLPAEFRVLPRVLNVRGGWTTNPLLNT